MPRRTALAASRQVAIATVTPGCHRHRRGVQAARLGGTVEPPGRKGTIPVAELQEPVLGHVDPGASREIVEDEFTGADVVAVHP